MLDRWAHIRDYVALVMRRQLRAACRDNGHALGEFKTLRQVMTQDGEWRVVQTARCKHCNMSITLDTLSEDGGPACDGRALDYECPESD